MLNKALKQLHQHLWIYEDNWRLENHKLRALQNTLIWQLDSEKIT